MNCLTASPRGEEILVSGSDDGCVGIWDPRVKRAVDFIETDFPITSVAVAEAGNEIYTGGIDCDILAYDIRKKAVAYRMPGHTDTVTSLSISPDSQSLLSYSHDGSARTWDIRPFAPVDRSLRSFAGAPVGVERNLVRACWDGKGERVGVGSGDGSVCVWEARTSKLVYKLPGHKGTVNDVRFAPGNEPISEFTVLDPPQISLMDGSCERLIRSKSDTRRIGELALIKSVILLTSRPVLCRIQYPIFASPRRFEYRLSSLRSTLITTDSATSSKILKIRHSDSHLKPLRNPISPS